MDRVPQWFQLIVHKRHHRIAIQGYRFVIGYQNLLQWNMLPEWAKIVIIIFTLLIPSSVKLQTAEQGNADAQNKVNNMGNKHK